MIFRDRDDEDRKIDSDRDERRCGDDMRLRHSGEYNRSRIAKRCI